MKRTTLVLLFLMLIAATASLNAKKVKVISDEEYPRPGNPVQNPTVGDAMTDSNVISWLSPSRMNYMRLPAIFMLLALGALSTDLAKGQSAPQAPSGSPLSNAAPSSRRVLVPEQVGVLLRPVLDQLQKYRKEPEVDRHKVDDLFYALTRKQGRFADEALVVLMCFDVMGESQEDADAVIARGRRMLPYVEKYRVGDPTIPGRAYSDTMLKSFSRKTEDFQGTTKAIKHGWRGTWDNPDG